MNEDDDSPICPWCKGFIPSNENPGLYPGAISRYCNIEICSSCGTREALAGLSGKEPWYVTFGQKYHREKHPYFGFRPSLPNGFVIVMAKDWGEAREIAIGALGQAWSMLYDRDEFLPDMSYFPEGGVAILGLL